MFNCAARNNVGCNTSPAVGLLLLRQEMHWLMGTLNVYGEARAVECCITTIPLLRKDCVILSVTLLNIDTILPKILHIMYL